MHFRQCDSGHLRFDLIDVLSANKSGTGASASSHLVMVVKVQRLRRMTLLSKLFFVKMKSGKWLPSVSDNIVCYWSSEIVRDEIRYPIRSTNTIAWTRLTDNEKQLSDEDEDKLVQYINRKACQKFGQRSEENVFYCVRSPVHDLCLSCACEQGSKHEGWTARFLENESRRCLEVECFSFLLF